MQKESEEKEKEEKNITNKSRQGKLNRAAGRRFELKVRADLEKEGWIVCRWNNNVEFYTEGK